MAIKVKHEGNVTSRAVAGAIGGQARRNAEDSKALSQRAAQENMAANRQLNGAHASPASPGHASAQLGHAPSLSAHAPTPTLATARMMNPILAERAETQQALARQQFEYKLSAEQKNELAKINSAMEDARRSGRFSDEELGELERQAAAKRMGIKPLPVPKEEPPKPVFHTDENGQRWIQNGQKWEPVQTPAAPQSVEDVYAGTKVDDQGRRWGLDRNGKLYEVGGGGGDDFASLLKLVPETRTEMKRNPATGKDEPVEVPLTMEERLAQMEQIRQMRDKFNAPRQPAPSTSNLFAFGLPIFQPGGSAAPAPSGAPDARPGPWQQPPPAETPAPAPEPSERDKKWSTWHSK